MSNTGREKFRKNKIVINFIAIFFSIFGKGINKKLLNIFRNLNGKIGILLRYVLLKNISKKIGDNVSIQPGCFLFHTENLEIGDNVSIHPMCYIDAEGGILIKDNVSIAHSSTLIAANHSWSDESLPIKYNKLILSPIIIEEDVWIGCGVRILAGVKISNRSIVAAGAVVNKSFDERSLIGGVPAKLLKTI
ncbi:acyltransferase [Empedobacter sp. GD03861]|uniref:acyltransferase n=1 Tax=Empedobacter sp. GD03861 TaxID=2975390 RepID=UPI0024497DBC|nr:acyltransferase [Empedobacter sp. GD03861]MDH0673401.1 acyltransferase [Empedobacter sp. GD03861]